MSSGRSRPATNVACGVASARAGSSGWGSTRSCAYRRLWVRRLLSPVVSALLATTLGARGASTCRASSGGAQAAAPRAVQQSSATPRITRSLVADRGPGVVRIVGGDGLRVLRGLVAEVLLVDDALRTHDEAHDAARSVLRRVREQREAARHLTVLQIAAGAAGRVGALRGEATVEVALRAERGVIGRELRRRRFCGGRFLFLGRSARDRRAEQEETRSPAVTSRPGIGPPCRRAGSDRNVDEDARRMQDWRTAPGVPDFPASPPYVDG